MAGSIGLYIIINAIFFSFLFWLITFAAKSLYTNKYYNYKLNFYECGFKSLTNKKINYSINYIMLILFLLVYDGEFLILIPFSLNLTLVSFEVILSISIFLMWLIIALMYDYAFNALDWQV